MIKGVQRKMIVVKTDNSNVFESAYFILRSDSDKSKSGALDMLSEATRIVNESDESKKTKKEKKKRFGRFAAFCIFLLGVIFGIASSFLAYAVHILL